MKVSTHLKSGNLLDAVQQAGTSLGNQASGFLSAATQQAAALTSATANTANNQWQSFTGWIGL